MAQKGTIKGGIKSGKNNETFPVHNPANGELIAKVANLDSSAAEAAIAAAHQALPG